MARQLGRGFWLCGPKRARRWGGERGQRLLAAALGIGLALFLIHQFDAALRPQLVSLAETQARNQITRIADRAVAKALSDQSISYSDMVTVQAGQNGDITTLTTDTLRLNNLRGVVMDDIVSQVENLDERDLGVPLGALTGLDLLSAIGPRLPVQVLSVASAEASYRNDFTGAGINQTLHRVMLDVTVTAKLLLPGGIVETQVTTPVCIAETVIVGQVPEAYLNWNQ